MKLKCKKWGNSLVVVIPTDWNKPEYVHIYKNEQMTDSELLRSIDSKLSG